MESVTATQIGVFIGCLIALLGLVALIKQIFTRSPALHQEFASKKELTELNEQFNDLKKTVEENFKELRKERSVSTANLYKRVEESDDKNQQITEELRKETKSDIAGVQERVHELLRALSEFRGEFKAWSHHPFQIKKQQ